MAGSEKPRRCLFRPVRANACSNAGGGDGEHRFCWVGAATGDDRRARPILAARMLDEGDWAKGARDLVSTASDPQSGILRRRPAKMLNQASAKAMPKPAALVSKSELY